MSLKAFIFLSTYALLVYGNDVERRGNKTHVIRVEVAMNPVKEKQILCDSQ